MAITWLCCDGLKTFAEEGLATSSPVGTERSYMLNSHLEPKEPKDRHVASTSSPFRGYWQSQQADCQSLVKDSLSVKTCQQRMTNCCIYR